MITPDELIQLMRECRLSNVRQVLNKIQTKDKQAYSFVSDFFKQVKRFQDKNAKDK